MEFQKTAAGLLAIYDGFMQGAKLTETQDEMQKALASAGCFAAAAYDAAPSGGADIHALTRTFLLALIDPTAPALDYLRSDPAASAAARDAAAQLNKQTPLPSFDYAYFPEDWEFTCNAGDLSPLNEFAVEDTDPGTVVEMATLIEGPTLYAARVPVTFDEDGNWDDTKIQWFATQEEAQTAANRKPNQ